MFLNSGNGDKGDGLIDDVTAFIKSLFGYDDKDNVEIASAPKEGSFYNVILDKYAKEKGIDNIDSLDSAMDAIAYHESAGTMNPSIHQYGGGPGRGIFQFEKGEGNAAHTALNRLKRISNQYGIDIPEEYNLLEKNDYDVSVLPVELQKALFIGNDRGHPSSDISDVAKGEVPLVEYWGKHHQTESDPRKMSKFENDMREFLKKKETGIMPSVNYQMGGMVNSLFSPQGGDFASSFIDNLSKGLSHFNNEPGLQNIFDQSDKLRSGFKEQVGIDKFNKLGGDDKLGSMFDLMTLFTKGFMGGGGYQDGGLVGQRVLEEVPKVEYTPKQKKLMKKRFKGILKAVDETVINDAFKNELDQTKNAFNMRNVTDIKRPEFIIPNMSGSIRSHQKGSSVIPVSPAGQYQYPGQMVAVPTLSGSITMDGVPNNILGIDMVGNAQVMPANSGNHQFAPGMVIEIPLPSSDRPSPQRGKKNKRKIIPGNRTKNKTLKRYNERNKEYARVAKLDNVGMPFGSNKRR